LYSLYIHKYYVIIESYHLVDIVKQRISNVFYSFYRNSLEKIFISAENGNFNLFLFETAEVLSIFISNFEVKIITDS
jgi:hypothetical protein